MSKGVYDFESDDYSSTRCSDLEKLNGYGWREDFENAYSSINDLICGDQKDKLARRGYALVINGPWGAGKTTATWALINKIKDGLAATTPSYHTLIVDRSFLPFGNVSETITVFLKEIAYRLWQQGAVDVRKDMEQFILEVTPPDGYTATLHVGPLSLERPVQMKPKDITHEIMVERFKRIVGKHLCVILLIDDLDRLRPTEIVQVMRLVEKLKALPQVLIFLPVYKRVIAEAFKADLQLPATSAATFLRKLTDFELRTENSLTDLSTLFCSTFTAKLKQEIDPLLSEYGIGVDVLSWFMLMHNIIIVEAITKAAEMRARNESTEKIFQPDTSQYLSALQRLFYIHLRINQQGFEGADVYPAHYRADNGHDLFAPFGKHYPNIADNPGHERAFEELASLRSIDAAMKLITKDSSLSQDVRQPGEHAFDQARQDASCAPAVTEMFAHLIRNSSKEQFVTDNYKLRDVKLLALAIQSKIRVPNQGSSMVGELYSIVKSSFDAFLP